MGWNGGGFGHMTFETPSGVAAWKAANVSHDQWTDWADWFAKPVASSFVVDQQLGELRKLHDPKGHGYFVLDEQGPTVDFAFDTGEDTVRDFSGTIAATLRAAAEHGARGTFYFLGTAGAEYDFTYKLELANGLSTMETLHEREITTVYEGEQYQGFLQRVMEALGITPDVVDGSTAEVDAADTEREALKQKASAFTKTRQKTTAEKQAPTAVEPTAEATVAVEVASAAADPTAKVTARKPPKATATKQPAATSAAAKKPAAKAKSPAAKQPAGKQPAAKKPAAKKAAKPAKKPAANKAVTKKPAANKAATKKPAANKPAANKPAANKPAANKAATKKPAAKKPAKK